jgi:hypothetical protein
VSFLMVVDDLISKVWQMLHGVNGVAVRKSRPMARQHPELNRSTVCKETTNKNV